MNTVPGQGSRTIRTEEAILISLAALEDKFDPVQRPKDFVLSESIPQSEDTGVRQFEPRRKGTKTKTKVMDLGDDGEGSDNAGEGDELSRFD